MFGAFAASPSFGQSAEQIRNSPDWTRANVLTDGGSVYSKPDFDSPVTDYLGFKTPLYVTRKAVPGQGGLGLFYRVRYRNKSGYMADTDIKLSAGGGDAGNKLAGKKLAKPSKTFEEDEKSKEENTLFFKRYIGAGLALVQYSEKFSGNILSSNMLLGGLRMTGPGTLFDGPPLDVTLFFTTQSPDYRRFASAPPTGFLVMTDMMLVLPFYEWKNSMIDYGLGVMLAYASYNVQVYYKSLGQNVTFSSQDLKIGVDAELGYTQRLGSLALKGDIKLNYEKTAYFSYIVSLQTEY